MPRVYISPSNQVSNIYARWVTGADVGVEPCLMGVGPAYSKLLEIKRAGLCVDDIDAIKC